MIILEKMFICPEMAFISSFIEINKDLKKHKKSIKRLILIKTFKLNFCLIVQYFI